MAHTGREDVSVKDNIYTYKSSKIQTMSGKLVDPTCMEPDDIDIIDIAYALSLQCRWNGHIRKFYSVAEHSVLVSYFVPENLRLIALLHDASEAYTGDIASPIKKHFNLSLHAVEVRTIKAILKHYDNDFYHFDAMPKEVKEADTRLLATEYDQLMLKHHDIPDIRNVERVDYEIICLSPIDARELFLKRFWKLLTDT